MTGFCACSGLSCPSYGSRLETCPRRLLPTSSHPLPRKKQNCSDDDGKSQMLTALPCRATEMDITMIGLQNAGKTSLLRVLAVSALSVLGRLLCYIGHVPSTYAA